jgi:hypothetical protein
VTGPAWLAVVVATLMLLIAASCAARLAIWRPRGRDTETDADGLHVLMGVAMAGMLEPRLSPVPGAAWQAVFAAAAAWFGWRAFRGRRHGSPDGWRCAHPAPHAVECAAMVYMLRPARQAGHAPSMTMPGMAGYPAMANPALALVLALFMLGYILWAADRLAALSRARTPAACAGAAPGRPGRAGPGRPAVAGALQASPPSAAARALAPRFAASYKIAMSIGMGYMLVTML